MAGTAGSILTTAITTPPVLSFRGMWATVKTDPSVTKVALYCFTAITGFVVAGLTFIMTQGGDVAALSLAIGGVLTALINAASGAMKRRAKNGGAEDA